MQTISIKSGTSAKISIQPKINNMLPSFEQMAGVTIYVFFVYQFTNKVYGEPYKLVAANDMNAEGKMTIHLTPDDTINMLGNAAENQRFEIQFAIKTSEGDVISDQTNSGVIINITRWEAGQWIYQESKEK
jgi:hypothetical protein